MVTYGLNGKSSCDFEVHKIVFFVCKIIWGQVKIGQNVVTPYQRYSNIPPTSYLMYTLLVLPKSSWTP